MQMEKVIKDNMAHINMSTRFLKALAQHMHVVLVVHGPSCYWDGWQAVCLLDCHLACLVPSYAWVYCIKLISLLARLNLEAFATRGMQLHCSNLSKGTEGSKALQL